MQLSWHLEMIESHYRAVSMDLSPKRDGDLLLCLRAMGLSGKNISNTTTFLIRQVLAAYAWQKDESDFPYIQKSNLHELQREVLDFLNGEIASYNAGQDHKRKKKITAFASKKLTLTEEELEKKKEPVEFTPLKPFGEKIGKITHDQIFDGKFLYAVVQSWDAAQAKKRGVAVPDTKALPGAMAQNVVIAVRDSFLHHFKALSAYRTSPEKFSGKPKEPGYLPTDGRKTLSIDMSQVHGKLVLSRNPVFWLDYDRTQALPQAALDAYSSLDVKVMIEALKQKHKATLPADSQPEQIRIVPVGTSARLEVVFSVPIKVADDSLLGQLMGVAHQNKWYSKKVVNFPAVLRKNTKAICELAQSICEKDKLAIAGADLGMKNLVSIGFHTDELTKGLVFTANRYSRRIQNYDARLDAIKSRLTPAAVKAIQQRLNDGQNPSKEDRYLLAKAYGDLYGNPEYLKVLAQKTAYTNDTVHKLTSAVIDELSAKKVQLLVVGKNLGWKTESNMGRKNNKEFHNFPHARLIEVLTYKAFAAGILVLTTEEAYSSKSSFINGGILPAHGEKETILAQANAASSTETASPPGAPIVRLRDLLKGSRGKGSKRHRFTSPLQGKKLVMHADINGAMNILRKVCYWLKFDPLRHALRAIIVGLCWGADSGKDRNPYRVICS